MVIVAIVIGIMWVSSIYDGQFFNGWGQAMANRLAIISRP
jgi:hypothetical protein